LIEAMAQAGLFRLWVPRSLGGEEADSMTLLRVVEQVPSVDDATGWCVALGDEYGVFSGHLLPDAARDIFGSDPNVITAGALRPAGKAVVVHGGYWVTGRWTLGSGCQHAAWMVGGCQIIDGDQPRLDPKGMPVPRLLFFAATDCEIFDTWHSIGLRGTGSHDYAVADLFVPTAHSLWFRKPQVEPGPLYAMPTIALFGTALAAVPLGIGRHAIDILTKLAETKIASRSIRTLSEDSTMQVALGRAEALLCSGRAFLYETLEDAWQVVSSGHALSPTQRARLWLASTHAASSAKQAAELMFSAGGSASPYTRSELERCVRDIHAACQHVTLALPNYEMAGQAFLGADVRTIPLLLMDNRDVE
jgi:indole-3-acetate monooxygenase